MKPTPCRILLSQPTHQRQQNHHRAHEDADPEREADRVVEDRADLLVSCCCANEADTDDQRQRVPEVHVCEQWRDEG